MLVDLSESEVLYVGNRAGPAARLNVSEPCDKNDECRQSGMQARMFENATELSDLPIRSENLGVFGLIPDIHCHQTLRRALGRPRMTGPRLQISVSTE
jgi:hypothetical protein